MSRAPRFLIASFLTMMASSAWSKDPCTVTTFLPFGCSTSSGLRFVGHAVNDAQLNSIGCVRLAPGTQISVQENIGGYVQVVMVTPTQIIPYWMNEMSFNCPKPAPPTSTWGLTPPKPKSPAPPGFEITEDQFVWKEGKRMGWFDRSTSTFFRLDQIAGDGAAAIAKPGERGRKMRSAFDWAVVDAESGSSNPSTFDFEKTQTGNIWVDGYQIGWIDNKTQLYYRMDQVERLDDSFQPKRGEAGFLIKDNDIKSAAIRAEKTPSPR